MAYYGFKPAEQAIQIGDNTIVSADIADGSIVNADLNSSAAIELSKTQLVAGTGITLNTNTLNVDAAQTQITSVGTLASLTVSGETTFSGFLNDAKIYNHLKFVGSDGTTVHGGVRGASNSVEIRTGASTTVACTFDGSQNATFAGHAIMADSKELRLGNNADLLLYHNGSNSYLDHYNTGELYIRNRRTSGDILIATRASNGDNVPCVTFNSVGSSIFAGSITAEHSIAPQIMLNDTGGTTNRRIFRISGGGDVIHFEGRNNDNSGAGGVGGDGSIAMMSLAYGGLSVKGAFRNTPDNNPNQYQLSFGGDDTSNPRWGFRVGDGSDGENLYLDRNLTSASRANAIKIDKANGYIRAIGVYSGNTSSSANVHVTSSGDIYRSTSAKKYKTDIKNYTVGLDMVNQMQPITYRANKKTTTDENDKTFAGLLADDIHDLGLTEFVEYNKDGEVENLHYDRLITVCINSIKELSAKVEALENG